ncbi:hypothetical protein NPIL_275491 [Nephila pilipes]|uniref:Uncharacterized protein n=1 Tax=Nephila pilipes TaxID=299642 RepID=A0A8X6Q6X0_NEPPI|nr:hypothetical protein NPIL_275491 [Nephila pilipes]
MEPFPFISDLDNYRFTYPDWTMYPPLTSKMVTLTYTSISSLVLLASEIQKLLNINANPSKSGNGTPSQRSATEREQPRVKRHCSGVVPNSTANNNNNAPQGYYYYAQTYDGNNNVHHPMNTHQNPSHLHQQPDGGGVNR